MLFFIEDRLRTMDRKKQTLPIIVSWIGFTDINIMNHWRQKNNLPITRPLRQSESITGCESLGENGPIRTFTDGTKAEVIYLLASLNYESDADAIKSWVLRGTNSHCEIIYTKVKDPSDYNEVYVAIEHFFKEYLSQNDSKRLRFLLSPGTPATQALMLYASQTRYVGCKAFRTVEKKYSDKKGNQIFEVILPFKITTDLYESSKVAISDYDDISEIIDIYAPIRSINILLLGESGVGKTLAAKKIHKACGGTDNNFITANCAELAAGDANMFRAALFGAKKGAYTGAYEDTIGLFSKAEGGTLFLDEIAEIPLPSQSILLRALQEKEIEQLGANKTTKIKDVRIIAATNHDLIEDVRTGKFREDLYYRIAMCPVPLSPLRNLTAHSPEKFKQITLEIVERIKKENMEFKKANFQITDDAWHSLLNYQWPGNVRQLTHVLHLSCVYAFRKTQGIISSHEIKLHLQKIIVNTNNEENKFEEIPSNLEQWLTQKKEYFINKALELNHNNYAQTAKMLGLSYQKMIYFINTHSNNNG